MEKEIFILSGCNSLEELTSNDIKGRKKILVADGFNSRPVSGTPVIPPDELGKYLKLSKELQMVVFDVTPESGYLKNDKATIFL